MMPPRPLLPKSVVLHDDAKAGALSKSPNTAANKLKGEQQQQQQK